MHSEEAVWKEVTVKCFSCIMPSCHNFLKNLWSLGCNSDVSKWEHGFGIMSTEEGSLVLNMLNMTWLHYEKCKI